MITQTETQVQAQGTLNGFITDRLSQLHNEEALEAFGKEFYHAVTQIVIGNEDWFTDESVRRLPQIKNGEFTVPKLFKYMLQVNLWFDDLSDFEQIALHNAKFVWS